LIGNSFQIFIAKIHVLLYKGFEMKFFICYLLPRPGLSFAPPARLPESPSCIGAVLTSTKEIIKKSLSI
jgi:hypothetical protein